MSIFTCWGNKFNCLNVNKEREETIKNMKAQIKAAEGEFKPLQSQIDKIQRWVDAKKKLVMAYEDYPKMWNDIPPLEDVGKPITKEEVKAIFKSSWNADLVGGSSADGKASMGSRWSNPDRNIEAHFETETMSYRIPMDIIKKIAERSMVSEWRHSASVKHEDGPYACNDFAASFFSEFKLAPLGYHKTCIGILCCTGHRINIFIPAEDDVVYYMEPQNDKIWFPNLDAGTSERTPFHVIF